jgi:hypothetical protein
MAEAKEDPATVGLGPEWHPALQRSSLGDVPAELAFCFATGNTPPATKMPEFVRH